MRMSEGASEISLLASTHTASAANLHQETIHISLSSRSIRIRGHQISTMSLRDDLQLCYDLTSKIFSILTHFWPGFAWGIGCWYFHINASQFCIAGLALSASILASNEKSSMV